MDIVVEEIIETIATGIVGMGFLKVLLTILAGL